MEASRTFILAPDATLVGRDLGNVYRHFACSSELPQNPVAQFKKKEPLENMAKSILKHRIKLLTGKSTTDIETEIGHKSPTDSGFDVNELRRMAHFLILEASGQLVEGSLPPPSLPPLESGRRKRVADAEDSDQQRKPEVKKSRKSLAPEMLMKNEKVVCRLRRKSSAFVGEKMELDGGIATLDLGPNPTAQMVARKRKINAVKRSSTNRESPTEGNESKSDVKTGGSSARKGKKKNKADDLVEPPPPVVPTKVAKKSLVVGFSGKAVGGVGSGGASSHIYLAQGDVRVLTLPKLTSKVGDFPGANLVVVHTPVTYEPPDIFSLVMTIRGVNRSSGMHTFSVLVGCGLTNVFMFREALYRQTRHVQFLVFRRDDADLQHAAGKLRDVNSFFLLAYFFEGCELAEPTKPFPQMVRAGSTTSFWTANVEDLENQIIHTFSEEGDWILDVFCGGRELSLAAQKTGRNAIAIHDRLDPLLVLKMKASAIAAKMDDSFTPEEDGMILQL